MSDDKPRNLNVDIRIAAICGDSICDSCGECCGCIGGDGMLIPGGHVWICRLCREENLDG